MMPMLTLLAGICPTAQLAHRRHTIVGNQTSSGLAANPAFAWKCHIK
jgi:hypothetical protein